MDKKYRVILNQFLMICRKYFAINKIHSPKILEYLIKKIDYS